MRASTLAGDRAAALACFEELARRLAELGTTPTPKRRPWRIACGRAAWRLPQREPQPAEESAARQGRSRAGGRARTPARGVGRLPDGRPPAWLITGLGHGKTASRRRLAAAPRGAVDGPIRAVEADQATPGSGSWLGVRLARRARVAAPPPGRAHRLRAVSPLGGVSECSRGVRRATGAPVARRRALARSRVVARRPSARSGRSPRRASPCCSRPIRSPPAPKLANGARLGPRPAGAAFALDARPPPCVISPAGRYPAMTMSKSIASRGASPWIRRRTPARDRRCSRLSPRGSSCGVARRAGRSRSHPRSDAARRAAGRRGRRDPLEFRRRSADAQHLLSPRGGGRPGAGCAARSSDRTRGRAPHGGARRAEWHRWLAAEPRGYAFVARIVRDVIERIW